MSRIVELPPRGKLIVATDLQGHLGDFRRLAWLFERSRQERPDTFLVITGDLVHGPELEAEEWPEHLGGYYVGNSVAVLEEAAALQRQHPGHVHYLLGNHEHAHIGGPVVGKFFPDEAARLEELLGPERTRWAQEWLLTWPLVAVAPRAGLCLLHGAPHAPIQSRRDIEEIDLAALREGASFRLNGARNILTALLWARAASAERARAFLRALGPTLQVAVHGHDVAREGFVVEDATHLCVSSSFGCHDGDKVYLTWELDDPAVSALDVARRGLRRLWPEATPVYLDPGLREG
jgi:hypothetical protein